MSDPMMDTEAWAEGERKAAEQLALQPPEDYTASVSRDMGGAKDRDYYKLCQICHWDRYSDKCTCIEEGKTDGDADERRSQV